MSAYVEVVSRPLALLCITFESFVNYCDITTTSKKFFTYTHLKWKAQHKKPQLLLKKRAKRHYRKYNLEALQAIIILTRNIYTSSSHIGFLAGIEPYHSHTQLSDTEP